MIRWITRKIKRRFYNLRLFGKLFHTFLYTDELRPDGIPLKNLGEEARILMKIKDTYTDFSIDVFKDDVSHIFMILVEAITLNHWEDVRPYISHRLYGRFHVLSDVPHHIILTTHVFIKELKIIKFKETKNEKKINVDVYFQLDNSSGVEMKRCTMDFVRESMLQYKYNGNSTTSICPNCGAPMDLSVYSDCSYCHTKVRNLEEFWALDNYRFFEK